MGYVEEGVKSCSSYVLQKGLRLYGLESQRGCGSFSYTRHPLLPGHADRDVLTSSGSPRPPFPQSLKPSSLQNFCSVFKPRSLETVVFKLIFTVRESFPLYLTHRGTSACLPRNLRICRGFWDIPLNSGPVGYWLASLLGLIAAPQELGMLWNPPTINRLSQGGDW